MTERPLRVGACFSGIGGLEYGFHQHPGFELVWQVEIDRACQRVLNHHWPDVALYDDITEVTYDRLRADLGDRADVDVLLGGWPCQDISLAGRRRGLAGERSGLFFQFARLALEVTPVWIVAENVPGLLSSRSPVELPSVGLPVGTERRVEETSDLGVVAATLGELGYGYAWRVRDAQFFGVPQRRRRVFLVGHLGEPWTAAPEVLFEPDSREGDPSEGAEEGEDDAPGAAGGVDEDGSRGRNAGSERQRAGEIVSSLTSFHGGADFKHAEAGHLVAQRGHGFGADPTVAGTLGGGTGDRGWCDDLDRAGALVTEEQTLVGDGWGPDVARTLTSPQRGHHYDLDTENFVVGDEDPIYSVHNGEDVIINQGVAQPVTGSKGNPGTVAYRKSRRAQSVDEPETWVDADVANTLNGNDASEPRTTHAIVEAVPLELRMATRTSGDTGVGTPGTGFGEPGAPSYPVMQSPPPAVQTELIVRRLTPLECERLQGFPDGWTDVPGTSDSARYRQLGNAVAVPVAAWIAERLYETHRRIHGGH